MRTQNNKKDPVHLFSRARSHGGKELKYRGIAWRGPPTNQKLSFEAPALHRCRRHIGSVPAPRQLLELRYDARTRANEIERTALDEAKVKYVQPLLHAVQLQGTVAVTATALLRASTRAAEHPVGRLRDPLDLQYAKGTVPASRLEAARRRVRTRCRPSASAAPASTARRDVRRARRE